MFFQLSPNSLSSITTTHGLIFRPPPIYLIKLPKFVILRPLYKFYSQNSFFLTSLHNIYPNFGFLRPLFVLRSGAAALLCPPVTPLRAPDTYPTRLGVYPQTSSFNTKPVLFNLELVI